MIREAIEVYIESLACFVAVSRTPRSLFNEWASRVGRHLAGREGSISAISGIAAQAAPISMFPSTAGRSSALHTLPNTPRVSGWHSTLLSRTSDPEAERSSLSPCPTATGWSPNEATMARPALLSASKSGSGRDA